MPDDLVATVLADLDLVARLVVASVFGALIGLEREIHDHPAGMRTHLLVCLGSAGFTILSIEGFPAVGGPTAPPPDPARVAAQIVSGIGFLGAGAILKEGATIRGLTTAANLWAVAAIGMATGAGAWVVAIAGTVLIIFSLGPLRSVSERFVGRDQHRQLIRVAGDPTDLGRIVDAIGTTGGTIAHLETKAAEDGRVHTTIEVKADDLGRGVAITSAITDLDGVEPLESKVVGE